MNARSHWNAALQADFSARACRYRLIDTEPVIEARTAFFGAAATICEAFACAPTTPFIAGLSQQLEAFNLDRASLIRRGVLYVGGDVRRNTRDFVAVEQAFVEEQLRALRACDPVAYALEIRAANRAMSLVSAWYLVCGSRALRALARAIQNTRRLLGRLPRFDERRDREHIGMELAISATRWPPAALPHPTPERGSCQHQLPATHSNPALTQELRERLEPLRSRSLFPACPG